MFKRKPEVIFVTKTFVNRQLDAETIQIVKPSGAYWLLVAITVGFGAITMSHLIA